MTPAETLLQLAQEIADHDPILSLELEKNVRAMIKRVSVINPGAQKFEDHVEKMVAVLKSLKQELENGLETLDSTDAKEFAKFFEDVVDAEEEQLRSALEQTKALKTASRLAAIHTAGPLDFVKNIFKKKPTPEVEEPSESSPTYTLDDKSSDDFVEGKSDWADASKYIEKEYNENKDFFDGVKGILTQVDRVRKNPTKPLVESLVDAITKMIKTGEGFIKDIRKALKPAPKMEVTEEGMDPKHPAKKTAPVRLEGTVEHYIDLLQGSLGDEKKTIKLLKELFNVVGPLVEDDRATLASQKILPVLVRTAHTTLSARPVLIPIIRRIVNTKPITATK